MSNSNDFWEDEEVKETWENLKTAWSSLSLFSKIGFILIYFPCRLVWSLIKLVVRGIRKLFQW